MKDGVLTNPMVLQEDPDASRARALIKALRQTLNQRLAHKQALEEAIRRFVRRQAHALNDLIEELLTLQIQQAEAALAADPSSRNREALERLRSMQVGYRRTQRQAPIEAEHFSLDEDEAQRIKTLFRRAVRLCHPDLVSAHLRDQAAEICRALTAAYKRNDLLVVEDILHQLEAKGPARQRTSNLWQQQIAVLERRIERVNAKIAKLKASEAHRTLAQIEDVDAYFAVSRERLCEQISSLKIKLGIVEP